LDHKSRIAVSVSGEPEMELSVISKKTLAIDLKNAIIPKGLLRNLDTSEFKSAVQSVQPQNIKRGKSNDARILVKLREEAPYETNKEGKIFWVDIENPKLEEAQQPPAPAVAKETAKEEETRAQAKKEEAKTGEARIEEVKKPEAPPEPKPAVQEAPKTLEKAEALAPVEKKPEKAEAKTEVPLVPSPVERKPEEKPAAEEGGDRERVYSGAKISLDFKDADIKNILRLIAEVSNLNIIASDDVSGKVTMRLVDVPWDQALDVILASRNLGMTRTGNVVRVAPLETLKREMQSELEAKRSKERIEDLVTEVIPLNYITANMILQTQVKGLLTERGDVRVHEQTNALVIKDIPKGLDRVKEVLKQLDHRTQQVVIEARVVEASVTFQRELGISWGFDKKIDKNKAEIKGGLPGNKLVDFPATPATGTAGVFQFLINSAAGMTALDIAISMHELNGDVRIISSPKIATLHNKEASIEQGLRIPYLKLTTEGTVTTDFIEANLKLTVLPHITTDGHIKMGIKVKKDAATREFTVQGVPSIDKKEVITDVLVKDNGVVVIGGIFIIDKEGTTEGIPLMSKIPLVGWLFKRDSKSDQRKDLLIFISPKIIG
jgi:type IV pilus assembly protein PilQ